MNAKDIRMVLSKRFTQPTHAIFFEVSDATGARHKGWADAISMSLWPSHGLLLEGYEIKVSRYDWKSELKNPVKAERFAGRCDKWWIVTCDGVIDSESEIPDGWGWMLVSNEGIKINRPAQRNPNPIAMDRLFLASLMRSADKVAAMDIEKLCEEKLKVMRADDERRIEYEIRSKAGRESTASAVLKGIELSLGSDFQYLQQQSMIDAIIAVYKSGLAGTWSGMNNIAETLEDAAKKIRASHESLNLPKATMKKKKGK